MNAKQNKLDAYDLEYYSNEKMFSVYKDDELICNVFLSSKEDYIIDIDYIVNTITVKDIHNITSLVYDRL